MPLLEVHEVTKEFPGVRALDGVSLDLEAGEVHALVGENGAGKSTLLKILAGMLTPSSGEIHFEGRPYAPHSPSHAQRLGISVIHQEFNLLPDLSIAENVFVGREPYDPFTRRIRRRELRERTARLLEQLGLHRDPATQVGSLSVSERQMVEIAKAMSFEAKVIVMDEPTAALSDAEVERLFAITEGLRTSGRGVIYVSHRLPEIFKLAQRVTVLRDGRRIATLAVADSDEDRLVQLMVGRKVTQVFNRQDTVKGAPLLQLDGVSVGDRVKDVSLEVRAGEIVGLAGLEGAGRYELAKAIFGIVPLTSGRMLLDGKDFAPRTPREALRGGVGFLPRDRKTEGIFPDLSVLHNLSITMLGRLHRGKLPVINPRAELGLLERFTRLMSIKFASARQRIASLSGGNQQKVLLARAIAPEVRLLVLCEATRGVDIGAKSEIHDLINTLTAGGMGVLMLSSDSLELLNMSDRVVVMYEGRVRAALDSTGLDEETVVAYATGQGRPAATSRSNGGDG
jgi:ABC-type sugar transport system ATPase subunit